MLLTRDEVLGMRLCIVVCHIHLRLAHVVHCRVIGEQVVGAGLRRRYPHGAVALADLPRLHVMWKRSANSLNSCLSTPKSTRSTSYHGEDMTFQCTGGPAVAYPLLP